MIPILLGIVRGIGGAFRGIGRTFGKVFRKSAKGGEAVVHAGVSGFSEAPKAVINTPSIVPQRVSTPKPISAENNENVSPNTKGKFREILKNLKTEALSSDKIERAVNKMSEVAATSGSFLASSVYHAPIKTGKFMYALILKLPLIFIIGLLLFTGTFSIAKLYTFILNSLIFFQDYIGLQGIYWISIGTTIFLAALIITFVLPLSNRKEETYKKELNYFIWFLVIASVLSMGLNSVFWQTSTVDEKIATTGNKIETSTISIWEEIKCAFDITGKCILEKSQQKTVQVSVNDMYSINFDNKYYEYLEFNDEETEWKLPIEVSIRSSQDFYIDKVECYIDKVDEEYLFDTIVIDDVIQKTNRDIPLKGSDGERLYCNNLKSAITKVQDDDKYVAKIIPIIHYQLKTSFRQNIPVVDYDAFMITAKYPLDTYNYNQIRSELEEKGEKLDFDSILTNKGLTLYEFGITRELPLVFGDQKSRPIDIILNFEQETKNFGDFISAKITNLELGPTLTYNEGVNENNYINKKLDFENGNYKIELKLKENEDISSEFSFDGQMISKTQLVIDFDAFYKTRKVINVNVDSTAYRD